MMKSRIICILLLLVGVSGIYAQSLTVTGKVVDNEGLEVIGGNVTVKGKQNTGTITDVYKRQEYKVAFERPADGTKELILGFDYVLTDAGETVSIPV